MTSGLKAPEISKRSLSFSLVIFFWVERYCWFETLFRKVSYETQPENLKLSFVAMNFSVHEWQFPGFGFHFEKGMVLP